MSWQDELRQLDQALADGRISADAYREGRDKVLAAYATGTAPASGPPTGTPPGGTPAQPDVQQQQQPQQQQQNPGPFAPPFRWTSASPGEATQVVGNRPPGNSEATQVVRGSQPDNPDATQVVNTEGSTSERTQSFHPVGGAGQQPMGQQWPRQQQQWATGSDSAPPWGPDTGVVAPNPGWLTQGPEVFERAGSSNRTRLIVILVTVVVLIGLAVGGFFLFGPKSGNNNGPNTEPPVSTTATPPTTTAPPRDDLSIATLPGHIEDHSNVTEFSDVPGAGFVARSTRM